MELLVCVRLADSSYESPAVYNGSLSNLLRLHSGRLNGDDGDAIIPAVPPYGSEA